MGSKIDFQREIPGSRFLATGSAVLVLLLLGSVHSSAHQGKRTYPILEITDAMLELIDLKDGSIDEWEELWEPSLTTLDFTREIIDRDTPKREIVSNNPADFDFRVWMGWNDTHNRLYVSGQFADDIHAGETGIVSQHPADFIFFYVNGVHTGRHVPIPYRRTRYRERMDQARGYFAPWHFEPDISLALAYNSFGVTTMNLLGQLSFLRPTGETAPKGKTLLSGMLKLTLPRSRMPDDDPEDSLSFRAGER